MTKVCKKGLKKRFLSLFNDVLLYGARGLSETKLKAQNVLQLHELVVTNVEDCAEGSHGFQLNHNRKSFVVYCDSAGTKQQWLKDLRRFTKLSREAHGLPPDAEIEARAVWVPDHKVKACMMPSCAAPFTLTNRRHHCRNCGKVVCGKCSARRAVLNKGTPERVCLLCWAKLGGAEGHNEVPVLGSASTETAAARGGGALTDSSDDSDDSADEALPPPAPATGAYAVAIYDNDDAEHDDELVFRTGDRIMLTEEIDGEWLEGYLDGDPARRVGIFPAAFVEVKVRL